MQLLDLRFCRSLLFLPASNPRAIAKARELDADMIILDLEDSVRAEDKDEARAAAVRAVADGFGGRPVAIRINGVGHPHHGSDMIAVRGSGTSLLVLPKVESVGDVTGTGAVSECEILAMIETPRGVMSAATIAERSAALIAGTNDLAATLGILPEAGRGGMSLALQHVVLAARAAGIAAFDGVHNRLESGAALTAEAEEGRAFGFDGKSVIHPSQIEAVNRVFSPAASQLRAAEALIAAATGGAERHNGRMIEDMHVEQARALLARSSRVRPD